MDYPIFIDRIEEYDLAQTEHYFQRVLQELYPVHSPFGKGKKVLIKPNLLAPKPPEDAITTHPVVIEGLIRALRDHGGDISIGDNTPVFNQGHTMQKTRLGPLLKKYNIGHYRFQNFIEYKSPSGHFSFQAPGDLDQFDHIINAAKLKTHGMMLTTLCVKNMYGCISTPQRIHFHFQADLQKLFFARMLLELYILFKPTLNILDGIVIHEGNGPSSGQPKSIGLLAASENGIALDYSLNQAFNFPYDNPLNQVIESDYQKEIRDFSFPWLTAGDFPLTSVIPPDHFENRSLAFRGGVIKHTYQYLFMNRPQIDKGICTNCRLCIKHCPVNAINQDRNINYFKCIRCFCCQELCPYQAVKTKKPIISLFHK